MQEALMLDGDTDTQIAYQVLWFNLDTTRALAGQNLLFLCLYTPIEKKNIFLSSQMASRKVNSQISIF